MRVGTGTRVTLGRLVAGSAVVLAVSALVVLILIGRFDYITQEWAGHNAMVGFGFGAFAWLALPRQPDNAAVWTLTWAALATGLCAAGYAAFGLSGRILDIDVSVAAWADLAPSVLPGWAALLWLFSLFAVANLAIMTVGLLLFPDGRVPSPRWRPLVWVALAHVTLMTWAIGWIWLPGSSVPYRPSPSQLTGVGTLVEPLFAVGLAISGLCIVGLVVKFRASEGGTRQQFRWIAWGGTALVVSLAVSLAAGPLATGDPGGLRLGAIAVGMAALIVAYGIAITRYRLYDIDVVISRSLVYGVLAVFITGVYVGVVVGVGRLIGADFESSPWLAIAATGLVAVSFEPVRARVQRWANRLVFGRRATPYEVLSEFSRSITASDVEVLAQVARSLAEGTTAASAGVWIGGDGGFVRAAVWPDDDRGEPVEVPGLPVDALVVPVSHDGEVLGAVTLSAARGQGLLPTDERLAGQVASGLGLVLRNVRLEEALRRRVEELVRSRQRIVTVQDETRRHLERNVHDGAQQRLVGLKVRLALARRQAEDLGVGEVPELLGRLGGETDRAIESLRDFARGIYPPLLEAEGLGPALTAQVRRLPIPVTVHAAGVGRHDRAAEAAVYFSVLEALSNVTKHAHATSAHVALHQVGGSLGFEVSDDGVGFELGATEGGSGLANLADRIDALNGTLEVVSTPGTGTIVRGIVPSRSSEAAP